MRKKQTVETDPQRIYKLELTDKDCKIMVINVWEKIDDKMENFTSDLEAVIKNQGGGVGVPRIHPPIQINS